jgi:hypothetical protein
MFLCSVNWPVNNRVVCGKGKTVPVLNQVPCHKDVWGSTGIAPTLTLDEGEWSGSRPGCFSMEKGDWVGPRAGLDTVAKRESPASVGNRISVATP